MNTYQLSFVNSLATSLNWLECIFIIRSEGSEGKDQSRRETFQKLDYEMLPEEDEEEEEEEQEEEKEEEEEINGGTKSKCDSVIISSCFLRIACVCLSCFG